MPDPHIPALPLVAGRRAAYDRPPAAPLDRLAGQACLPINPMPVQHASAPGAVVAVIGGGFSGVMTAVGLLREPAGPRVVLVERDADLGRGPAYGTVSPRRLLNVHAGGMSAFPDQPDGFVHALRAGGLDAGPNDYVARHLYGAYVDGLLAAAVAGAAPGRHQRVRAETTDVAPRAGGGYVVHTTAGTIEADAVVLAVGTPGHGVPDGWPASPAPIADPRFIEDPRRWQPAEAVPLALLFGTGLTMLDVALDLAALSPATRIVAVSRRGLAPLSHAAAPAPALAGDVFDVRALVGVRPLPLVRRVRAAAATVGDWRRVVASLRPVTDAIWAAWTPADRRQFQRHAMVFWNTHRHRAAPVAAGAVAALMTQRTLDLLAGRVVRLEGVGTAAPLRATIELRGGGRLDVSPSLCINCAGPDYDPTRSPSAVVRALLARGLARPGPLAMGLDIAADAGLVAADGRAASDLFALGAVRVGVGFETTAVPELRVQAAAIAARLLHLRRS